MHYAWYSKQCDQSNGHKVYLTPGGREVRVTHVGYHPDEKPKGWGDAAYVGLVVKEKKPELVKKG